MPADNINENKGVGIYFSPKTKARTKRIVTKNISNIVEKSDRNMDFFNKMRIYVYRDWSESSKMGDDIPKEANAYTSSPLLSELNLLYIKTDLDHKRHRWSIFGSKLNKSEIKEALLHEVGHSFDYYFASTDKEIESTLKEIATENNPDRSEEFKELFGIYMQQSGLSDSDAFKEAWKKDMETAFKGKSRNDIEKECAKLRYYSPLINHKQYSSKFENKELILEDGISDEELAVADRVREEIFAELFCYAMGGGSKRRQKKLVIKTYPNSYEVVKNYVNEYLGIECDNRLRAKSKKRINYES